MPRRVRKATGNPWTRARAAERTLRRTARFTSGFDGEAQIIIRTEINAVRGFQMAQLCAGFQIGKLREDALLNIHEDIAIAVAAARVPESAAWPDHPRLGVRSRQQFFADEQGIGAGDETERDRFA